MQFKKILVPTDFSKSAEHALDRAVELAKLEQGEIHLLHCYDLPRTVGSLGAALAISQELCDQAHSAAQKDLDVRVQRVRSQGVKVHGYVTSEIPTRAILEAAGKLGANLIVMGTQGLTGMKHMLLGSVAERTVRFAECPVMTVRAPDA